MEYIIQGKFSDGKWYLYTLAGCSFKRAKTVLNEVMANPSLYSPKYESYSEFRIIGIETEDCWWNQGSLD